MNMTENEKRAHDLAVATTPYLLKQQEENYIASHSIDSDEPLQLKVDIFQTYMSLYESAVEAMNDHFPDGK